MPESRIDDLNSEQLRAATAGEGPVLTIAGAGTGKTKTLAARVAWLVSQGIDPGRIMLLTFTRRASDEMLRRARRALGETGSRTLGTVWGGTFHSVANRLLRTYGEAIGPDSDFTVMDQSDAEDLMDASRQDHALGSRETVPPQTDVFLLPLCQQFRSPRPYARTVRSHPRGRISGHQPAAVLHSPSHAVAQSQPHRRG
jgi:DNA helicase II / ATP-dependent DNA helicase PcrA